MVNKFKTILDQIENKKGSVSLFVLLKMDDLTDKWSVLLAAPWIDEKNFRDTFIFLRDRIIDTLTEEERNTIARIGILPLNEHIVQELLKYKTGTQINDSVRVNGNIVHQAEIIKSSN